METKAEYVADTYVVDKLLVRDMVLAIQGGELAFELLANQNEDKMNYPIYLEGKRELRATLTQVYDRWPELAN